MAPDWHHMLHNTEKPELGRPRESTRNRHHHSISKWQIRTKKLSFEMNFKVQWGKDIPNSASALETSTGALLGLLASSRDPSLCIAVMSVKDSRCTTGNLHHCGSQVWEQIFPACSKPDTCMSRVCGGLRGWRVVDQTQPLAGPSHPRAADPLPREAAGSWGKPWSSQGA